MSVDCEIRRHLYVVVFCLGSYKYSRVAPMEICFQRFDLEAGQPDSRKHGTMNAIQKTVAVPTLRLENMLSLYLSLRPHIINRHGLQS